MPRILVVDDDPHIRDVVAFALTRAGMVVGTARTGVEAWVEVQRRMPDLIVLDIGMPDMDGLSFCQRLRAVAATPILFLSARDEEVDRVLGFELGGDDYVTKPFSPRELVARVQAILKRAGPAVSASALEAGRLRLEPTAHRAQFADQDLTLTALEFAILQHLIQRPHQVFSRAQILAAAYPAQIHVSDRTIDSHIRNLRAKLAEVGCRDGIETVHGVGFRLGRCQGSGA